MSEPPIVNLSKALGKMPALREKLPDLADLAIERGADPAEVNEPRWPSIVAGRGRAREIVASRPDVSPTGAVYIDLRDIEAILPNVVDELLEAWPLAQPIGANEDVQVSWDIAVEHRAARPSRGGGE